MLVVPAAQAGTRFDAGALDHALHAEPGVLSVLVERDGRLIFERYFRGAARRGRLDVFSITKSVTSTLIGIALHDGSLRSLDQRLGEFFPKEVQHARDKRVRKITLRQLLTMTSGYRDVLAARSDDWLQVAGALRTLSPRQRTCVVLVDYADMDASGAARVLGMKAGTVRVHLMRGRRAMAARIGKALAARPTMKTCQRAGRTSRTACRRGRRSWPSPREVAERSDRESA